MNEVNKEQHPEKGTKAGVIIGALARFFSGLVFFFLVFWLSSGTLAYLEAWIYLAVLFIPTFGLMIYMVIKDPGLLQKRMQTGEQRGTQRVVMAFFLLTLLGIVIIPGIDIRFGWSQVPFWLCLVGDAGSLLGYIVFVWVLKTNTYASRIVEVQEGQKVIDFGPYAIVRHPLYLGTLIMYIFMPLALGSTWTLLITPLVIPLLVIRAVNEEKLLTEELEGYRDYKKRVKYRILPFLI